MFLATRLVLPDVLVKEDFEKPGQWQKRIKGKGSIELVPGGAEGKCLKIVAETPGVHYYTIQLDPKQVRGKRLVVTGMVKTENVAQGKQAYSTAKFHVGGRTGGRAHNRAKWFVGTRDWFEATLIADVPDDMTKPVFDLGIQGTTGTVYFDSLVIDDGLKAHMELDLAAAANTSYSDGVANDGRGGFIDTGTADLRGLPTGEVTLGGIDFRIMAPGANWGATCVALKGKRRPNLPTAPKAVKKPGQPKPTPGLVKVNRKGRRLLFLQAAAWVDKSRTAPCVVYTVRFADGKHERVPIVEGVDVGAFDAPQDLPNWTVVWTDERAGGTVGLGVTQWRNPRPDVAIESISLETPGTGAVPIVVAITLDREGK